MPKQGIPGRGGSSYADIGGRKACFSSPLTSNHNSKKCCLGEKLLGIHLQDELDMFAEVALRLEVFVERL